MLAVSRLETSPSSFNTTGDVSVTPRSTSRRGSLTAVTVILAWTVRPVSVTPTLS